MATILLIDDNELIRAAIARTLKRMGYDTLQVDNGKEAVAVLGLTGPFELIISDVRMPHMDGVEFYRWLITNHPEMVGKFIFCTSSEDILDTLKDVKDVPRLGKPSTVEAFKAMINRIKGTESPSVATQTT